MVQVRILDGKKLEIIYIIGKIIQKFQNNFKGESKEQVSLACVRRFALLFSFNCGE